jgi:hypothetical protein
MRPKLRCFLSAALISAPALANDSVYTDVSRDKCRLLREWEGASSQSLCPGIGDYPVHFIESDIRQGFFFGHVRQSYLENGFESFGPFNHAETTVEWRLDDSRKPIAAILRWIIENPDPQTDRSTKAFQGQVLVISKVAQKEDGDGCVVGYVDALANADANTLARRIADERAASFRCGTDQASYHGNRGDKAGEPMHFLPK